MRNALALAVAACLLVAAFPAAAPAARDRCAVKGSRTLGASEHLRLYRKGGRVHMCRRATGRKSRFDNPPNKVRIDDVEGWRIAYVEHDPLYSFAGAELDSVRVYDARRDELIVDDVAFSTAGEETHAGEVGPLSLLPGGGVAWIAENTSLPDRPFEVQVSRPGAAGWDLLDTSPAIEIDSLAVNRRHVYWTRDGVAQRATCPADQAATRPCTTRSRPPRLAA